MNPLSACYLPLIPDRQGEIRAIGHLSPFAQSRLGLIFRIDRKADNTASELEQCIAGKISDICNAWPATRPLFIELPYFGPQDRTSSGMSAISWACKCLRQRSVDAIPVAGPVSAVGPELLQDVRDIARHDQRGAAIRVPYAEITNSDMLHIELQNSLTILELDPTQVDLFLDIETPLQMSPQNREMRLLTAVLRDALLAARKYGTFRNIVLCGSSVPETIGKEYNVTPYRGPRFEMAIWRSLLADGYGPISFSDSCITPIRGENPVGKGGRAPPPRVRISTPDEYIFFRSEGEYRNLCAQVVESADFMLAGEIECWGTLQLMGCANRTLNANSPTQWVTHDTNLHIESTLRFVVQELARSSYLSAYQFGVVERDAWLQRPLLEDETSS